MLQVKSVLLILICSMFCFGFSQGEKQAVFNTPVQSNAGGTVSSLGLKEIAKKDSIKKLVAQKKVAYNLGFLPLDSIVVTSSFGSRKHPITGKWSRHRGVDLRGKFKDIKAVQKGIIIAKGYDKKLGQYVKLKCGTFVFVYGHLNYIYINKGDVVKANQIIGQSGGTGGVTAEHLHFAIEKSGKYIDPLPILQLLFSHS